MKLIQPQTLIIILVIVLLIFGPKQLPQLGKSLGKTMKSIRDGVEGVDDETADEDEAPAKKSESKGSDA
ncbi:MAG: twin-arginine translocase TatA/TatE family subunit [Coriobacteriia bacterium]